jgi:hypothetical protein
MTPANPLLNLPDDETMILYQILIQFHDPFYQATKTTDKQGDSQIASV